MTSKLDSILQTTADKPTVLHIPEGMLGFSRLTRYVLVPDEKRRPFLSLQCLDDKQLAFPVVDPHLIDPDYTRLLPTKEIASLKIRSRSELVVLVVAILRQTPGESSVNLKAPLLINYSKLVGRQIILADFEMRAPVTGCLPSEPSPLELSTYCLPAGQTVGE